LLSTKKKKKEKIGLLLGPILFVIAILIPTPQSMVDAAESKSTFKLAPQITIGSVLWILTWWITECVALGLAALLAPLIFVISGILSIDQSLSTFSDPIIWIFVSGFVLAAAFHKYGLDKRIAYSLAMLYKGNNPKIAIFFVAYIPVFLLTMAGSITASTAIVFPFVVAFMGILGIPIGYNNNFKNNDNLGNNSKNNDAEDTTTTKKTSNDTNEKNMQRLAFLH
jgi:solute carrier family 13 (sodium-dependent dicarboxylate transporter), member 2/3/5